MKASLGILAMVLLSALPSAPVSTLSHIGITVFACAADIDAAPKLIIVSASATDSSSIKRVNDQWDELAPGVFHVQFDLPAGNYNLNAKSSHCFMSNVVRLSVLQGHRRDITVAMGQFAAVDAYAMNNSIAVLLPSRGLSVDLRESHDCSLVRRGTVDDGVAYFEGLYGGHYILEISAGYFYASEPVAIPDALTYHRTLSIKAAYIATQFQSTTARQNHRCVPSAVPPIHQR